MTVTPETQETALPFYLHDFDWYGYGDEITALINSSTLPFDTAFRLASVGHMVNDPLGDPEKPNRLVQHIMQDLVKHHDQPDLLRPDTCELIWGERPNAIIDWYRGSNHPAYTKLDPMYYDMVDLTLVIKRRRREEGKSITESPPGSWLEPKEIEINRCMGLARPIWRVIVHRTHPEWLRNPIEYYAPAFVFHQIYYPSERVMANRILEHTVLCDSVVLGIYNEAKETGVKGIGPVGREDLRTLLAEEHPELH